MFVFFGVTLLIYVAVWALPLTVASGGPGAYLAALGFLAKAPLTEKVRAMIVIMLFVLTVNVLLERPVIE